MTVVVGVSPTTGSPAALRFAAEEAALRGTTLRAVVAFRARPPVAPAGRPPAESLDDDVAAAALDRLRGFVRAALGDAVQVDQLAVRGSATSALLSAARDADLLVLGEPRAGRLRAVLVAPQVVLRAPCPVVVMPTRAAPPLA